VPTSITTASSAENLLKAVAAELGLGRAIELPLRERERDRRANAHLPSAYIPICMPSSGAIPGRIPADPPNAASNLRAKVSATLGNT
jgi:hypothetical protein